jgi:ATP:ADP antiporter, AAA family
VPSSPDHSFSQRLAMTTATVALAHQVGAKAVREAVFLSTFPSTELPKAMVVSALASIPLALLVTRAMARWGLALVAPAVFAWSAVMWALEWSLLPSAPIATAVVLYLHVSVGGAILLSSFWSVIGECFDPHQLKRLVGRVGASGTVGGMIGGALIERTSHWLGARSTMLALAGVCAAASVLVGMLARGHGVTRETAPTNDNHSSSGYLIELALLVFFAALVSTFADFALKQAAASHYPDATSLVRFFALFYAGTSVGGFLLQVFASRKILEAAGVGATLAAAPTAVLVFGAAAVMSPTLLPIAALKAAETSLVASLYRSAYEPLFAPIPAALKRSKKALLDVACDKGGEVVGALLVLVLTASAANQSSRLAVSLAGFAAAVVIYLSFRAQRGYVAELERSLRSGTVSVDATDLVDPMARLTLSGTTIGLDRAKLLEYIAHLQAPGGAAMPPQQTDDLVANIRALLGGDVIATRQVLRSSDLDARLAAFIIPLLAVNGLAREATEALRQMGRPAVALMGDVMRNPGAPLVVRRRIPQVLRFAQGEPAILALTGGLEADQFVVRSRAGWALREVLNQSHLKHPDPDRLLRLALCESAVEPLAAEECEHLLVLLELGTSQESIGLVRQAIRSRDRRLRGTAIEYLESLLPDSVRSQVVTALAKVVPVDRGVRRAARELGDELERSVDLRVASPDWSEQFD